MSDTIVLEQKVKDFLRIEGEDRVLSPLISAAIAYLENAGVEEPELDSGSTTSPALALYELAVILYVNAIYSGGENKLGAAMTAIMLQIKDYGSES